MPDTNDRICGVCFKPRFQCDGSNESNESNEEAGTSVPASSAPPSAPSSQPTEQPPVTITILDFPTNETPTDWREDTTELLAEIGAALDEISKMLQAEIERKYVHPGLIPETNPLVKTMLYATTANASIEFALQAWDRARREGAV